MNFSPSLSPAYSTVARVQDIATKSDTVYVRDLKLKTVVGSDVWLRSEPQPINVSLWMKHDIAPSGETDDLPHSLNYAVITREVSALVESNQFSGLESLAQAVAETVLSDECGAKWVKIQIDEPEASLYAKSTSITTVRKRGPKAIVSEDSVLDFVSVGNLQVSTLIGVNITERLHRQNVVVGFTIYKEMNKPEAVVNIREVTSAVNDFVQASTFKTIEALVTCVAQKIESMGYNNTTVRIEKPNALTFADAAGIEITRNSDYFTGERKQRISKLIHQYVTSEQTSPTGISDTKVLFPDQPTSLETGPVEAFIAFGSNEGNQVSNINQALEELKKSDIEILQTSSLFESEPMYVTDQAKFINGVVKVRTSLSPIDLLDTLQHIESVRLNRVKLLEKGPRSIDLDILLYNNTVFNHPRLTIPHIGMLERSFVLEPLCELLSPTDIHPLTAEPFVNHLKFLPRPSKSKQTSTELTTIIPTPSAGNLNYDTINRRSPTQIMAIINITPDSFSDGGKNSLDNIVEKAEKLVDQGATILDIGGFSTRPHAATVSLDEELRRVVPVIQALRTSAKLDKIAISIDTYRSEVSKAALNAGADIINDISAGMLDHKMFEFIAQTGTPIILNHTRGTPQTMNSLAHYTMGADSGVADDSDEAVVEIVGRELEQRVQEAYKAGVKKWQIILDPGLGFAKKLDHNMAIIRNLDKLINRQGLRGFVWLVGPSRKQFIGTITGVDKPADRVFGTGITCSAMIEKGADIIRVHDIEQMSQVVKMADAIYRHE
ncbi:Dihydropteroate synthase [Nadsonia fulvescens var. elongata DSM 6958]|uniref:Folic acid synthesis protein fol1 n=1 Tax=Nadsonia fulvescens var. elongata DSM 6958 TaxID=857566 RepID=A0A1E3PNA3_9ASCO|nr:Dihydropteroate synthase [Nadsonia fulvescens var. elongata DSM 6958]